MIATDHSPHTLEEKGCDINGKMIKPAIWDCISGFCGVETAVPLLLTEVNKGRMTLNHYVKVASENPARVWQMYPKKGAIRLGSDGDVTIVDMDKEVTIDPEQAAQQEQADPLARLEGQGGADLHDRSRPRADEGRRAGRQGRSARCRRRSATEPMGCARARGSSRKARSRNWDALCKAEAAVGWPLDPDLRSRGHTRAYSSGTHKHRVPDE